MANQRGLVALDALDVVARVKDSSANTRSSVFLEAHDRILENTVYGFLSMGAAPDEPVQHVVHELRKREKRHHEQ